MTGTGDLIDLTDSPGANVTISNVTGTAIDPGAAGLQRGSFLKAQGVASLTVQHSTITGASIGVSLRGGSPSLIIITENKAINLDDRVSDGAGGFGNARPVLGHFVLLQNVAATAGVEIAWNEVVQTMGQSSIESGIEVNSSQGSAAHPILVHDNYIEGASSPAAVQYSGNSVLANGNATDAVTAFAVFRANVVVHTSGGGIMIANGHDITALDNRVVSCGRNADGTWYARYQVTAVSLWNYYSAPQFFHDVITTTGGGMVVPDGNGAVSASDVYANAGDLSGPGNRVDQNVFTDPCIVNGVLDLSAEEEERAAWNARLSRNRRAPGVLQIPF